MKKGIISIILVVLLVGLFSEFTVGQSGEEIDTYELEPLFRLELNSQPYEGRTSPSML